MKNEIVHIALKNLQIATGIEGKWHNAVTLNERLKLDGELNLEVNKDNYLFTVDVKNEVRPHQLHQIELYHKDYDDFLLIANHIFPRVKEALQQKGIPYLEANGNIFLKRDKVYLFVNDQKTIDTEKTQGNRAFTKTGLKVLFYLLQHKEDINLTQRELAKNANVALGNIPQIIKGLQETGYLLPLNRREYVWENRRALLERWVTEYATTLKPTLRKEKYVFQGDWKEIKLNNKVTVWGGEPAADILTNYLRPERLTIYTRENRIDLMRNYKLKPNTDGDIEVLEMFWQQNENQPTAPAILVYADLLLEGGKRNNETAEIIYNEYIQPNL